jgi:hypothetical protein
VLSTMQDEPLTIASTLRFGSRVRRIVGGERETRSDADSAQLRRGWRAHG